MRRPGRFRKSIVPAAGLLLAATTLCGVAGCQNGTPATPAVTPSAHFGGTDLAWIEITIAMDEQLKPLLALVPGRSRDPRVLALARQVASVTDTELATLRALHDEAGLPAQNPHEGMPMPGIVSAGTVTRAAALSGAAFDKLVVQQITAGWKQAENLAESERKAGIEPRTLALAASVIHTRTEALGSLAE